MATLFNQAEATQEISISYLRRPAAELTKEVTFSSGTYVMIQVLGPYTVFIGQNAADGKEGLPVNCHEVLITEIESPFYIHSPYGSVKVLVTPGEVV